MGKSRKEMEHRQRRKYILECAEKLFAEKGFDGVTVADIAKASEFSVGSLYLFFENKEEIIKRTDKLSNLALEVWSYPKIPEELIEKYGLGKEAIKETVKEFLNK